MSDSAERNCNKCIHHTSGMCDSWDCEMQTVEDVKKEAVNEYVKSVVEKLETIKDGYDHSCLDNAYQRGVKAGAKWLKKNAIEIVKQGCVSDDVCEWKYTKEIMDNAEFKVGCNQNALKRGIVPNNFSYHDFKYCPYCGKKIKVVE